MPAKRPITYDAQPDGCWRCTSHRHNADGIPRLMIRRRNLTVARALYEERSGAVPEGHWLRRQCGAAWCVRPDHGRPESYAEFARRAATARGAVPVAYELSRRGCWICTSHRRDKNGYPVRKQDTGSRLIHRQLYEKRHGPLSPGTILRHYVCDDPGCVNPDHMRPGTHAENVADRVKHGRSACGSRNGRAKLTPADVIAIRSDGAFSHAEWARRLGVNAAVVRSIRAGKTWRSVGAQTTLPL